MQDVMVRVVGHNGAARVWPYLSRADADHAAECFRRHPSIASADVVDPLAVVSILRTAADYLSRLVQASEALASQYVSRDLVHDVSPCEMTAPIQAVRRCYGEDVGMPEHCPGAACTYCVEP